jgi:hypothetical protein
VWDDNNAAIHAHVMDCGSGLLQQNQSSERVRLGFIGWDLLQCKYMCIIMERLHSPREGQERRMSEREGTPV